MASILYFWVTDAESVVKKGHHMLDGSRLQVSLLNLEQFCERNVAVSSFSTGVCESKALALESKCIVLKKNALSMVQGSIKHTECTSSGQMSSAEDGVLAQKIPYALHPLRSFPSVAFETVPVFE